MGILRLAHVDVRTPDLDLATAYYTEVMGLQQVSRDADAVYLKCWDEEDHHSLRMRYDPRTGLDSFTFRVEAEDDLHDFEKRLAAYGCQVAAGQQGRGDRAGRVDPLRGAVRPDHGAGLGHREDRQHPRQAQPRHPSRRPTCRASRRRGWTTCWSTPRRSPSPPLLPSMCWACGSPSRCSTATATSSASGSRAAPTPRTTSRSSTAPTAPCTTGPTGSTTGTTSARPPTRSPTTACRSTRARRATASPAATPSTSSTRSASATRSSPAATGSTRTPRSSPGPRTDFGKGLFYYENVISQRFLRMHT